MIEIERKSEIEEIADKARLEMTVYDVFPSNMRIVFERIKDLHLSPRANVRIETEKLAMDQAYTISSSTFREIVLSRDTFDELDKSSRANFTLAHELGHLLLHTSERAMSRAISGRDYRSLAAGRLTSGDEIEANFFAAAFLMPRSAILKDMTAQMVAAKFRVSLKSAQLRLDELFPVPKKLSELTLRAIEKLKHDVKNLK